MKTLIINPIPSGGVMHYTYSLCQALSKQGIEVILVTTKGENEITYFKTNFSVKKVLYPLTSFFMAKGFRYLANKRQILKLIEREKPETVHFQWLLSARLDPAFIKKIKKRKILTVYTAHNLLPHEPRPGDKKKYKRIYQTFDKIIVHAKQNKRELIKKFNVSQNKVKVIYHGNLFAVSKLSPELTTQEARRILGLSQKDFILLFFGNIRPYRGLDTAIKAMVYLRNISEIKLIVVGKMHNFSLCRDLIDLLRIRDTTSFYLNYIPLKYVGEYFYAADVVVCPYHKIYQSGVIQLAYSFGRPVISTKTGGIPEVIDQGKSGFLVPTDDPKSLAKKILEMYQNQEKTRLMGRYALELAKTKFNWSDIAKRTIEIYSIGRLLHGK